MADIPYLTGKDVPLSPSGGVATYDPNIIPNALEKAGAQFKQDASIMARQQRMEAMQDTLQKKMVADKATMDLMYGDGKDTPGLLTLQGANARGADTVFETKFKDIRDNALSGVTNPYAQKQLEGELDQMEESHYGTLKAHIATQSTEYSKSLLTAQNNMGTENIAKVPLNDAVFDENLKDKQVAASNQAMLLGAKQGDPAYAGAVQAATGQAVSARLSAMYDNPDPAIQHQAFTLWNNKYSKLDMDSKTMIDMDRLAKQAAPRLQAMDSFHDFTTSHSVASSEATPEDAIRFVQGTDPGTGLEGGSKTVTDSNGSKAQFGLNAKWNGDLDIGNLTSDQAVVAAKERYWDKYKISDLPKPIQAIAFDTYYNMDPVSAKILVDESAGDPARLLQLRENHYRELAQRPEMAGNLPSWLNRNKQLGARVGDGPINPQDAADYMKQLPAAVQEPFKALVDQHNAAISAKHDTAVKQTMDTALNFIAKNGKGYDFMPIGLQDSIDELGMTDLIKQYPNRQESDPSALAALNKMDPNQLAKTDLNQPGVRLELSMQDYSRMKKKQESMANNPQALESEQQRYAMMKQAFVARGLSLREKRDPQDPEKITFDGGDQYNRANGLVDEAIDSYVDKNKSYPPATELQKMVDNVFTKVVTAPSNHFWTSDDTANKYDDIKVPVSDRAKIIETLHKNGRTPTDNLIKYMYLNQLPEAQ